MSHVTLIPLSRSKGQGHQAALLSAALTRKVVQRSELERIRRGKILLRYLCEAAREVLGCPWGYGMVY